MSAWHLDWETASACEISNGSYRYAEDPSTRILMFGVAKDDGAPLLWSFDDPHSDESLAAESSLREAVTTGGLIYAHNAQFELAIATYRMEKDLGIAPPSLDAWRCTAALCRRAAAPESLAAAAEFFGLGEQKDPIGKALIGVFSDQNEKVILYPPVGMKDPDTVKLLKNGKYTVGKKPKNRKSVSPILDDEILWDWLVKVSGELMTVRTAWELFKAYCRKDVSVEQELHKKLKHFELKGDILESFQFDLRMNWRGLPLNVKALQHAQTVVEYFKEKLSARFRGMCQLEPGQRDATLAWLRARGYPMGDLKAATVEKILESPPESMTPMAVEVLKTRSLISFAALAKIPTVLAAVGSDGRVRGTVQWHAARTGRGGGRILQPQNLRKTTIEVKDQPEMGSRLCYKMICAEFEPAWFEELWDSPLEAIASSIRHFIQPHEGGFFDGDFVGVEARLTVWAVGDTTKLQMILDGVDMYKRMATFIFNVDYDQVTKLQRTIAKAIELGCGFGGSGKSIMEALAKPPYNVVRTLEECNGYVKAYRTNHPETVAAWRSLGKAAISAVKTPGKEFLGCNDMVSFVCGKAAGIDYLVMKLPSGRKMYYPKPTVKEVFKKYTEEAMLAEPWKREKGGYHSDELSFYGKIKTKKWGRVFTHGAKLLENFIQATGADLLNRGCIEAERRGYPISMIIHDQALCEESKSTGGLEGFLEAMCVKDAWAETFPLASDGALHPFYLKDD